MYIYTYISIYVHIHIYMAVSCLFPCLKVDPPREGHAVQIHVRIRRIRKDGCFRRRHLSIFHLFSIEAMNLQSFFMKEGEGVPPFIPPPVFAPHLETSGASSSHSELFHFKLREIHHFCSWSLLIFNIPTLGTFQLFIIFSLNLHFLLYVSANTHYSAFLKFI